jgi:Protein of unknown function (DUF3738)
MLRKNTNSYGIDDGESLQAELCHRLSHPISNKCVPLFIYHALVYERVCRGLFPVIALLLLGFFGGTNTLAQEGTTKCFNDSETSSVGVRRPVFEVVSIKESDPKNNRSTMDIDPDGIRLEGFTLRDLVRFAYGINQDLIVGGPQWADSTHYAIQAKVGTDGTFLCNRNSWRT